MHSYQVIRPEQNFLYIKLKIRYFHQVARLQQSIIHKIWFAKYQIYFNNQWAFHKFSSLTRVLWLCISLFNSLIQLNRGPCQGSKVVQLNSHYIFNINGAMDAGGHLFICESTLGGTPLINQTLLSPKSNLHRSENVSQCPVWKLSSIRRNPFLGQTINGYDVIELWDVKGCLRMFENVCPIYGVMMQSPHLKKNNQHNQGVVF